jgi:hypothetical protein
METRFLKSVSRRCNATETNRLQAGCHFSSSSREYAIRAAVCPNHTGAIGKSTLERLWVSALPCAYQKPARFPDVAVSWSIA